MNKIISLHDFLKVIHMPLSKIQYFCEIVLLKYPNSKYIYLVKILTCNNICDMIEKNITKTKISFNVNMHSIKKYMNNDEFVKLIKLSLNQ